MANPNLDLTKDRIQRVKHLGQSVRHRGFFEWTEDGVDLRLFSTIGIGGRAACVVRPTNEEEIQKTLEYCMKEGISYSIKGNGSNTVYGNLDVLIDLINLNQFIEGDDIRGNKIIGIDEVNPQEGIIIAQAGVLLGRRLSSSLNYKNQIVVKEKPIMRGPDSLMRYYEGTLAGLVYKHSLSGTEDLPDIPGTVGGATFMNAGAYQQWMGQIVEEVMLINPQGNREIMHKKDLSRLGWWTKEGLKFRYRYSILQEKKYQNHVLYAVKLRLNPGDQTEIKQRMFDRFKGRHEKHPRSPSIGSIFRLRGYDKEVEEGGTWFDADELIKDAEIGGKAFGGIYIPKKYPIILINKGGATLEDFNEAVSTVYNLVRERTGIRLQREIKYLPYDITPDLNGNA